jgi:hypothetical protein
MKIKVLTVFFMVFLTSTVFIVNGIANMGFGDGGRVPSPQLVRPLSEVVDLAGKDVLEFKWIKFISGTRVSYYDFRLYKGYAMTESTLIFQKQLSGNESKISVDSKMFEDGQVYSWSVRMQIMGQGRGDRSYHSFKIKK